jgi:hypothetical protein
MGMRSRPDETPCADAAVAGVQDAFVRVESVVGLSGFRLEFDDSLSARADGLFELVDALPCAMVRSSRW